MNAIIITSANFPFGGAGANYLRLFSTGLAERGWGVDVLLLKGYMYGKERIQEGKKNNFGTIRYIHCGRVNRPFSKAGKVLDNLLGLLYSAWYVARKSNRSTTIFIYNNEAHLHFLVFFIARLCRLRIISFVPEGLETRNRSSSFVSSLSWASFSMNMNYFNFKSSKLIVFSAFLRDFYLAKGYNPANILIIPNLLDLDFFDAVKESGDTNHKFRIGYCGNPGHKDGIEDLFESFRIIARSSSDSELLIIGDSENQNSVLEKFKTVLKNDNLTDRVIFTGLIPYKEVPGKLQSCDVLVLARPSGTQAAAGFPTKLGEYFACRKPVVITKVGDIPAYFKDGEEALLAEPDNPDSIAAKILWVKANPEKASVIAQNGYEWAKEHLEYRNATAGAIGFLDR